MSDAQAAGPAATPIRARAVAALDALTALLARSERPDLDTRAAAARQRLEQSTCTVLVVGEFKKGKSSLINALLNAPVCPVDDDVATAKPIELHHSATPSASVVYRPDEGEEGRPPRIRPIDFEELPAYASEPPSAPDASAVTSVRIGLPRHLLSSGLVLVDTPGVGGLGSTHSAVTVGALPSADAVLFVTDASQELTASEVEFMRTVRSMCPTMALVMTKVDFYPAWRKIIELDVGHLRRLGLECPVFPTSAPLRAAAIERNDRDLNTESGYGELVTFLRDELAVRVEQASLHRLAGELGELLDHLESQLRAELTVLDDPEESAKLVRQLEAAKERADRLRSQASRWQLTLNDGTADLVADVEHDLRARFRQLVREAEEALDDLDPGRAWDEFEPWLSRRATADVVQNYTYLHQRAVALAAQVAMHFDADHREIAARLDIADPTQLSMDPGIKASLKVDRPSPFANAFSALRGGTGGVIMMNLFASLAGVGLAAPVMVSVGLLLGRKTMKDERTRQLAQRRMLAKQAVRKYTDDLAFTAGKDSRDTMRRINRQLKEHFMSRAEELTTSTSESLAAAQQALRSSEATRTTRRQQVTALLEQLARVRAVVAQLQTPVPAPGTSPGPAPAAGSAAR